MTDHSPLHDVRWHVPSKYLGIKLPQGYHVLEAPLRLILYFGDDELSGYQLGTDVKQIEREAAEHFAGQQASAAEDVITHLPWSMAARTDAAQLALAQDLHVICIHLTGMGTLMDVYGYQASLSALRQISRRLKRLVDERDRLTRHSGDKLLIFTTRPIAEIESLVEMLHEEVAGIGLETDGERLPQSRIGVATVDRVTDPAAAATVIDAVVISAEVASAVGVPPEPQPSMEPAPALEQVFPAEAAKAAEAVAPSEEPAAALPQVPQPAEVLTVSEEAPPAPPVPEPAEVIAMAPAETAEEPAAAEPTAMPPAPAEEAVVEEAAAVPAVLHGPLSVETITRALDESKKESSEAGARIQLKAVSLDLSGVVATASVKLVFGERQVTGKAVGRGVQERRLFLMAEATARAVTEFLPAGYGVVIHDIQPAPPEVGKALWAVVLFLTPTGEQSLLGIAPIDGVISEAAAKAVLSAVNRRVGLLLGQAA